MFSLFLSLVAMLLGFLTVLFLSISNIKFTKGDLRVIIEDFGRGTIATYAALSSQFFIELFQLFDTWLELLKYLFLILGFTFYLLASIRIYRLSTVLGFAGSKIPEKLKKILHS